MRHWDFWPFGVGIHDSWIFVLLKFIFIGFVLGIIIWMLKIFLMPSKGNLTNEDPLDILKIRLAKGEITPEEYEKLKKLLKN